MDVRDFAAWAAEAKRRALWRRSEMYGAALLPNQKTDAIRQAVESLNTELYEIDHEAEITDVESAAKRRLDEMREKRRRRSKKP